MLCENFILSIFEYLDNSDTLTEEDRAEFETHYLGCNTCWETMEKQKKILSALKFDADDLIHEEIEVILKQAQSCLNNNEIEKALECYKEALRLDLDDNEILNKIVDLINMKAGKSITLDDYIKEAQKDAGTELSNSESLLFILQNQKLSRIDKIKKMVKNFISDFYPKELSGFENSWKLFHDFEIDDLNQYHSSGALAAVGETEELPDEKSPEIIISLVNLLKEEKLDKDELAKKIDEIKTKLKMEKELIDQINEFLNKNFI